MDDIGITLQHADEIKAFEQQRLNQKPWLAKNNLLIQSLEKNEHEKKLQYLPVTASGPEIMAQALKVLTALKLPLEFEEALVGGVAYAAFGHPLPAEVVELAKKSDAVLFGAVGGL